MAVARNIAELSEESPTSLWRHEEHDFTPWMLENLDRIGEALGMELEANKEDRQREVPVGRYIADIEAKETGSGRRVIIENQLTVSDHSHLGQSITYAAGREASIVVWVCWKLREEHRRALDWLNAHTDEDTGFFGVEIEVLKIGDSAPALRFNPVVKPTEWDSPDTSVPDGRPGQYQAFFQPLIDELRNQHNFTTARKAQPQAWFAFSIGVSGVTCNTTFTKDKTFRAEIYISTGKPAYNKSIFDILYSQKDELEKKAGMELLWDRGGDRNYCRISTSIPGAIDESPEKLAELRSWAVQTLQQLKAGFSGAVVSAVQEARNQTSPE